MSATTTFDLEPFLGRDKGQRFDRKPMFGAPRSADQNHDIIELKQPFVACFEADGT